MPDTKPARIIIVDIDGLRRDIFRQALAKGDLPNIQKLFGGKRLKKGLQFDAVSTFPSITFCCQASIFTGAHPAQHGITGNQFFDRFGAISGKARPYTFDIGTSQLALDDGLGVYLKGLASNAIHPSCPTIYERASRAGLDSTVVFNMYAKGAKTWIKPGLEQWRKFFAFEDKLRFSSEKFDEVMVNQAIQHLRDGNRPFLLTLYFWGLDHTSHLEGPSSQEEYLVKFIDPLMGKYVHELETLKLMENTLFILVSDHGQAEVIDDMDHTLRLGFPPFERGVGHVFKALKLDVLDIPGERNVQAVLGMNGGVAQIYLRRKWGKWKSPPKFKEVVDTAKAFWDGTTTGRYFKGLYNAFNMILVRNTDKYGWRAPYMAYTPHGIVPIESYLKKRPNIHTIDAQNRISNFISPNSGDILLMTNYLDGFQFGYPYKGVHGGLHPEDSQAVLAFGMPNAAKEKLNIIRNTIDDAIQTRRKRENNRDTNIVDMAYAVNTLMDWA